MKPSLLKNTLLVFLFAGSFLSIFNCSVSDITGEPFYSPESKELYNDLLEVSKQTNWTNLNSLITEEMKNKYRISEEDNDLFVSAKLNINDLYSEEELWQKGIKVGTRINSIVEVRIPLYEYLSLNEIEGIDYVDIN